LKDIKVKFSDAGQPMSFNLELYFEQMKYWQRHIRWGQNQKILIPFLLMDQKLWDIQGAK
jgi:hypothetical protein